MLRVRHAGGGGLALSSRLLLAVLASLALHLYFVLGTTWKFPEADLPGPGVLHARLEPGADPERAARPQRPTMRTDRPKLADLPAPRLLVEPVPEAPRPMPVAAPLPAPDPSRLAPVPAPEPVPVARTPATASALPDLLFHPAVDLDVYPALLDPVVVGGVVGAAGQVTLDVLVDEFGGVSSVSVRDASPEGAFDAAVEAAWRSARFTPARIGQRAVRSRLLIQVEIAGPGQARQ